MNRKVGFSVLINKKEYYIVKQYKYLNHSRNHAMKILAFFEILFQMIEELTESHSINSQYGRFDMYKIQDFLSKQRELKSKIKNEEDYCLNLIIGEINSVFNPSITELNILNSLIKKFPTLEKTLQDIIKKKKAKHLKLTEALNISELGLSSEIRKQFADLQKKFDNQTERMRITFGLN